MLSIGIKDKSNNSVYVATMSLVWTCSDTGYLPSNFRMFRPKKSPRSIVSYSGTMKYMQQFKVCDDFLNEAEFKNGKLDETYLHQVTHPRMVRLLKACNLYDEKTHESLEGSFLFAHDDVLLFYDEFSNSYAIDDFKVIGNDASYIEQYLRIYKDEEPLYRILKAISLTTFAAREAFPIAIWNTKTKKTITLSDKQLYDYISKYEKGGKR